MVAGLAGSLAPDLDMLWFYLVDGQSTHHHHYLTHRPALWLLGLSLAIMVRTPVGIAFTAAAMLHLALDSIVGEIAWAWPFSDITAPLVIVPATQEFWLMSFLVHWTFKVEIVLTLIAASIAIWANLRREP